MKEMLDKQDPSKSENDNQIATAVIGILKDTIETTINYAMIREGAAWLLVVLW